MVIFNVPTYEVERDQTGSNGEACSKGNAKLVKRKPSDGVLFHHCLIVRGSMARAHAENSQCRSNSFDPHFAMFARGLSGFVNFGNGGLAWI